MRTPSKKGGLAADASSRAHLRRHGSNTVTQQRLLVSWERGAIVYGHQAKVFERLTRVDELQICSTFPARLTPSFTCRMVIVIASSKRSVKRKQQVRTDTNHQTSSNTSTNSRVLECSKRCRLASPPSPSSKTVSRLVTKADTHLQERLWYLHQNCAYLAMDC